MNEKQIKDANAYIAKIKRQRQILENQMLSLQALEIRKRRLYG